MEKIKNYVLAKNPNSMYFELMEKLFVHQNGLQHYAFSVFIFNSKHELLLQKRAEEKYHSAGLWSNTCCSHPLSKNLSEISIAAQKRLYKEMGIHCNIKYSFNIEYNITCENMLIENEIDFVFVGFTDATPSPDKNEVSDFKWASLEHLKHDALKNNPEKYTQWFRVLLQDHYDKFTLIFNKSL